MRVRCGFTFAVVADTGVLLSVRVTSGILQGLSLTLRISRGEHTQFTIQPHDEVSEVLLRSCPRLRRDLQFALFAEDRRLSRCGRSPLFGPSRWWTSLAGLLRSASRSAPDGGGVTGRPLSCGVGGAEIEGRRVVSSGHPVPPYGKNNQRRRVADLTRLVS